jgi:hypothetical protein
VNLRHPVAGLEGRVLGSAGLGAHQSALHGLLAKVRDLGLILIAVRRLDARSGEEATP